MLCLPSVCAYARSQCKLFRRGSSRARNGMRLGALFRLLRRAAAFTASRPTRAMHLQAFQGGNGEEAMSAEQLELLREYLRAQEEQEALLQAQVENLKREVGSGLLVGVCGCWAAGLSRPGGAAVQRARRTWTAQCVQQGAQGQPAGRCWVCSAGHCDGLACTKEGPAELAECGLLVCCQVSTPVSTAAWCSADCCVNNALGLHLRPTHLPSSAADAAPPLPLAHAGGAAGD